MWNKYTPLALCWNIVGTVSCRGPVSIVDSSGKTVFTMNLEDLDDLHVETEGVDKQMVMDGDDIKLVLKFRIPVMENWQSDT